MESHDENRTFETGSERDGGKKPALQLISPHAMFRLGEWLRFATEDRKPKPYPPRNWEKGQPFSQIVASLQRHVEKFKLGDTTEDHVAAILFGGMALAHYEEEIKAGRLPASLDDMPHYLTRQPVLGRWLEKVNGDIVRRVDRCSDFSWCANAMFRLGEWLRSAVEVLQPAPRVGEVPLEPHGIPYYLEQRKPFTVYLCGPITGRPLDVVWRDAATMYLNKHGIQTLDPCRGKNLQAVGNAGMDYEGEPASTEMADRDQLDVEQADLIFAHFPYAPPRQSIGSLMEMGGAAIGLKKPIVLCSEVSEFNEHLFCRRFCVLEPDFNAALEKIVCLAGFRARSNG